MVAEKFSKKNFRGFSGSPKYFQNIVFLLHFHLWVCLLCWIRLWLQLRAQIQHQRWYHRQHQQHQVRADRWLCGRLTGRVHGGAGSMICNAQMDHIMSSWAQAGNRTNKTVQCPQWWDNAPEHTTGRLDLQWPISCSYGLLLPPMCWPKLFRKVLAPNLSAKGVGPNLSEM